MNNICPVCKSTQLKTEIKVKDYFLTAEEFELVLCESCGVLFTWPQPTLEKIGRYYDSQEYFSHGGKTKGFVPAMYNGIKKINIQTKFKQVTKDLEKCSLLDIGCGIGDFLAFAKSCGWNVSGLEPNEQAREVIAEKHEILAEDVSAIKKLTDNSFNLITLFHVLEHVHDLDALLIEIIRILKPGGRLVVALPNNLSWDAKKYKMYWAGYDVPRHLYHFDPESFAALIDKFPLQKDKIVPMKWDAYYVSLLSEKYSKHNLPLLRAGINGFISNLKARRTGNYSSLMYFYNKTNK
ncbi:MAG: class I SAM-dependent methyltransferase [Bacteroidetes bacterium]|jgi:SAM-dependent methyltransferase|nr:class I SAM-dependent methyltransferase [Bacteroidota bacterium]